MSLIKKIKDKKVNFEFNKEYIKVVTSPKLLITMHNLLRTHLMKCILLMLLISLSILDQNNRESLIKLNNFNIDPEVFIELKRIQFNQKSLAYLSSDSIVKLLKNLESDDAITILENVKEKDKNVNFKFITTKRSLCITGKFELPRRYSSKNNAA